MKVALAVCCVVLGGSGCFSTPCGRGGGNANVTGEWTLSAKADRAACSATDTPDEAVRIRTAVKLRVRQESNGGGADTLYLADDLSPDGGRFVLAGTVEGSCVDFTTLEQGPGYNQQWQFEGRVNGSRIEGSVREGGARCEASGDFDVLVLSPGTQAQAAAGTVIDNPDGSVRYVTEDAGCNDEETDAGTTKVVCETTQRPIVENVYRCFEDRDCPRGVCSAGVCVTACTDSTECNVGEACVSAKCEAATGCEGGCSGGGELLGTAATLLLSLWMKARTCRGAAR